MVAIAGGYYEKAFQVFRGVTKGEPLSPTIYNMVVDAVVQHRVEEKAESAVGQGGHGREGRHQNTLFYADYGMIALSELGWLQGAFST